MLEKEVVQHASNFLPVDIMLVVGTMERVIECGCESQVGVFPGCSRVVGSLALAVAFEVDTFGDETEHGVYLCLLSQ